MFPTPLMLLLAFAPLANAETPILRNIDAMASLPVTGIKAVESDGRLLFMSDNGRFVIDGTLYDVWAQQPLTSLASIRSAGDRLDLRRLGLPLPALPCAAKTGRTITVAVHLPHSAGGCARPGIRAAGAATRLCP